MRKETQQALFTGLRDVSPMLPGVVPFGMLAGIAAIEAGMGPLAGLGMSVIIFAGASQLIVAQLVAEGALPLVIIATALLINLRMVMYSASLAPYFGGLSFRWKAVIAYLLTDQAYALTIARYFGTPAQVEQRWYYMGVAAMGWVVWLLSTGLGVWLGAAVPPAWQIGFALPLVFLVLLVPVVNDRPSVVAAVVGGSVAVLAYDAPYHLGLTIGAVAGICSGMLAESLLARRRSPGHG
ncbi:MAG: AzlC family ABC transporter permease [Ectothiorhodospiraceae bacterium]|nr:AzlC family ABC transporter permease [Ectothiorhodospiraceae bacterium]